MKDFFSSPYLLYPLIIAGMIAEFRYNLVWAGNVSLFALWALIALTFMALFADSKELFEKKSNNAKMILCAACLVVQIAIGWVFTAVFFAIGWFFLLVKKAAYYQEVEKAN
tara:strand:- start:665 stop:997 length:333 start_codon:yes stop_codon:yes gene_type:complete